MDNWNPEQYEKFKDQRAKPFWDLLSLIQPTQSPQVLDLGCGTGELTLVLHGRLKAASTLGLDSSANMLDKAQAFASKHLKFEKADMTTFQPPQLYDVLFSNAALQWVGDHESIFPKILNWVAPQGQVAIQMPANHADHPSHLLAAEVAKKMFPQIFPHPHVSVMGLEWYAELLFRSGFHQQECQVKVYGHAMESGRSVVEWAKGTLLTRYQNKLSAADFQKFLTEYEKVLLQKIGEGPYYYAFKRMLLWGKRDESVQ